MPTFVARGIVAAVDRPLGYEIINLGRGHPVRLREFIDAVEELAGRRANLVPAPRVESDAVATGADITKARRLLGFEPRVSVRQGVEKLYRWYVERDRAAVVEPRARPVKVGGAW